MWSLDEIKNFNSTIVERAIGTFLIFYPSRIPRSRNQKGTGSRIRIATLLVPNPKNKERCIRIGNNFFGVGAVPYIVIFRGNFCKVQKVLLLFTCFRHQKLWYLVRLFWIAMKTRILPDLKLSFRTASSVSEYFRMDHVRLRSRQGRTASSAGIIHSSVRCSFHWEERALGGRGSSSL